MTSQPNIPKKQGLMRAIQIYILSAVPVILEGLRGFLKARNFRLSANYTGDLQSSLNFIIKKNPHIILVDDTGYNPADIEKFINEAFKKIKGINIIVYTSSNDGSYLKNLVRRGIRGLLNQKVAKERLIDAIRLVGSAGIYVDSNITFSIYSYDIKLGIQSENQVRALSRREKELLALIADGIKNKEIAELLFIAQRTVESHKSHLLKKLNLRSTTELTIFAVSNKDEIKRQLNSVVDDLK